MTHCSASPAWWPPAQTPTARWPLLALGLLVTAACKEERPPAGPAPAAANAADALGPYLPNTLPPEVTGAVLPLLQKEQAWLLTPPPDLSRAELDKAFADLRWEVARAFGPYDVEGAISYARTSLQQDEAHPERWEWLGDMYGLSAALTAPQDAANAYDNAVFLNPGAVNARRKLAAASLMLGDAPKALRELEFCLFQLPADSSAELVPLYLAACAAGGELERGVAFCGIMAPEGGPAYRVAQAILQNAHGKRAEALALLGDLVARESPGSPLAQVVQTLRQRYHREPGGAP